MSKAHHCCGTCGSGVGCGLYMRMPCVHLSERKKEKKIRKMGWEREERVGAKEPPWPLANTWAQLSVLSQVIVNLGKITS